MTNRTRVSLDKDWRFKLAAGELLAGYETWTKAADFRQGVPARSFDDSAEGWRQIDLPHDFVIEGEFIAEEHFVAKELKVHHTTHGSRPGGVGWYRKRFNVEAAAEGKRVYLYFDGVYRDARVYLNEFFVGRHASGYTSAWYDVTDVIEYGGENLLVVRADATRPEGWFYEGGGIYRHVWLVETHAVHVLPWGTFVSSDVDLKAGRAVVKVRTEVGNRLSRAVTAKVTARLRDAEGREVGKAVMDVPLAAGGEALCVLEIAVEHPRLWGIDTPYLYTVESLVEVDGVTVDECRTTTGIRHIRFDAERGFFLNGRAVKIKGVCCHQDHAGVGVAVPDGLQEFRLQRLKEMGCNAYRCAHHPPTPELLDAADRLGMLVMDENRRLCSSREGLADLESMIRRDRNHPSVIMWSIGNEEGHVQWTKQSVRLVRTLQERAHALDPTRPVTLAICFWNAATKRQEKLDEAPPACGALDVMGFNYAWSEWVGYHARYPQQPIIISEASSNLRTRGCRRSEAELGLLAWDGPQVPYRDAEEQWSLVAEHAYLSGIFIWTGFDYRGEPGPYRWPAVGSQFGVLDACGFPKDNYFYYRAAWRDEPLVHVFPHWNWAGEEGAPINVACYSNCDEVELLLNGRSLGRKAMVKNGHLEWPGVIYEPGVLEARGYRGGTVAATARVETTGAAHGVRLTAEHFGDVCVVDAAVIDAAGRVVPTADNEIVFEVQGGGKILGVGNGHPGSHEADQATHRRAFNGLCQAILQMDEEKGVVVVTGRATGLMVGRVEVKVAG